MAKTCDFKEAGATKICGAVAIWIADVSRLQDDDASAPAYSGTSWSVALCERHYQELLDALRVTGTAHRA